MGRRNAPLYILNCLSVARSLFQFKGKHNPKMMYTSVERPLNCSGKWLGFFILKLKLTASTMYFCFKGIAVAKQNSSPRQCLTALRPKPVRGEHGKRL